MFLVFSAYANDPLPRARPDSVGLSPDRLERIGQVLRADMKWEIQKMPIQSL
jgi:hypothetical protein